MSMSTPRPLGAAAAAALVAGLVAGGCGGGGGGPNTVDPLDLRSWNTRDATPLMSMAMPTLWQPSSRAVGVIPSWGAVRLGSDGREGIVLGAWGNIFPAAADVPPMRLVVFEQGADGRQAESTATWIDDAQTFGVGEVTVADVNGDGRDDVFMLAYNETPPTPAPGVAFVSNGSGRFVRHELPVPLSAPRSTAHRLNGQWHVFSPASVFNAAQGRFETPYWRWTGTQFVQGLLSPFGPANGSALVGGDFAGDGGFWLVRSDNNAGPGLTPGAPMTTRAWPLDVPTVTQTAAPVTLPTPYFNGKAEYAGLSSWLDPDSKTHNAALWTTDLNQDGRLDIVAGAQVWAGGPLLQASALQLLLNQGGMLFTDETDALRPEFIQGSEAEMSMRFVDLDGSGIDTLIAGQHRWPDNLAPEKHGSVILLNDGTGRLYAAMRDEFEVLARQVNAYVNAQAALFSDSRTRPRFMAYRTASGRLNFLAMLRAGPRGFVAPGSQQFAFVNLALELDVMAGFKRDLTLPTRNASRNIRTFAGNDTIHRALPDPDCRIDGGGGLNTAVYPGRRADWALTKSGSTLTVQPVAGGGMDTLVRIQRLRFDDQTLDVSTL
jgi:hypothetical protein